jgi:hypothetical protein
MSQDHESDKCVLIKRIEHYDSGALKLVELYDPATIGSVHGTPPMMDPLLGVGHLRPPPVPQHGVFNQGLPDAIMPQDMAARAKGGPL